MSDKPSSVSSADSGNELAVSLYELLTNEEDSRACADIPDSACRETPLNFVLLLCAHFLTKAGDAVANARTVLPWVLASVGAPVAMTGLLVPIRESGSLIPQLLVAAWIRRLPVRKWAWIAGAVVQSLALIGIGLGAAFLTGVTAGATILALLTVFSLARGVSSVASKDVLGKTVPKRRRGQLTGWAAGMAGLVTIVAGILLLSPRLPSPSPAVVGSALVAAAGLWLLASMVYGAIREFPGETEGGSNGLARAVGKLGLLRSEAPFRRFVATRALLLCSALSAPFYVVLAGESNAGALGNLGLFVVASGGAGIVSAPVWGRFADVSSRRVMVGAATIAGCTSLLVAAVGCSGSSLIASSWFLPTCFFALMVAHGGVRVGRKTYVVDLGRGNRRTDYVTVSNSIIGVVLLMGGLIGSVTSLISVPATILVLSMLGLAGAALGTTLPEVE